MEAVRHSDLKLTMKIHTDVSQLPLSASVAALPSFEVVSLWCRPQKWWQGPESNWGHAASSRAPPALGTRKNPRPLPTAGSDVFAAAKPLGIGREVAAAFIAYQNFNRWRMNGAVLLDWQKALTGFAKADHQRMRALKIDRLICCRLERAVRWMILALALQDSPET